MEDDSNQALADGEVFGQYKITRILGEGGMGQVYEVEHKVLETVHALKLINPAILEYEESLQYFRNEARVMANLSHPGIVAVDDFGETDGYYWLRSELIQGIQVKNDRVISLDKYLEHREELLHECEVHAFLRQALSAIGYAHTKGVIHCDLKPANILLHPKGAKIADFGIVRLLREDFHRHSVQPILDETDFNPNTLNDNETAIVGTYEYMSPEQRKGFRVDGRSDLYAIGLIAYQMLTGHNLPSLKPATEIRKKIHPAWDQWLQKALEENPADRFRTAQDMLTSLPNVKTPANMENEQIHHFLFFDESPQLEANENSSSKQEPAKPSSPRLGLLVLLVSALTICCAYLYDKYRDKLPWEKKSQPTQNHPHPQSPKPPATITSISPAPIAPPEAVPTTITPSTPPLSPSPEQIPSTSIDPIQPLGPKMGQAWIIPTLNIRMMWIPPGTFKMGSPTNERLRNENEGPQHSVQITKGFWLARTETRIGHWNQLNPGSRLRGNPNLPAHSVSWLEATKFCEKLQTLSRALPEGYSYRLPTEAEWEYACRAGSQTPYWFGNSQDSPSKYMWNVKNSDQISHPVGTKPPNAFGLYNMHGNVREWCQDIYSPSYMLTPQTDPHGPESIRNPDQNLLYSARGGSWRFGDSYCRSASRKGERRSTNTSDLGFRVALATGG